MGTCRNQCRRRRRQPDAAHAQGLQLLVDLKACGLTIAPELATGDGALGFWKALEAVSPTTRHQRCTVHKTANVLDKLPKSVQPGAKADLREIWQAPDRLTAEVAIATFAEKYAAKYDKAVTCLVKDRDALLAVYDFPAEHWDHLRTSNPIESVFATVRPSHGTGQGRAVAGHCEADGVRTRHGGCEDLASTAGRPRTVRVFLRPLAMGYDCSEQLPRAIFVPKDNADGLIRAERLAQLTPLVNPCLPRTGKQTELPRTEK